MVGRLGIVLGVGLLVAGVVIGARSVVSLFGLFDRVAAMQRFVGPGSFTMTLPDGESVIYAETRSRVDGKVVAPGDVDFACSAEHATIETKNIGTFSYSDDTFTGHTVFAIEVPRAGAYAVACTAAQPFVIAVGQNIVGGSILGVLAAIALSLLGGALITLVVWKRDQK